MSFWHFGDSPYPRNPDAGFWARVVGLTMVIVGFGAIVVSAALYLVGGGS